MNFLTFVSNHIDKITYQRQFVRAIHLKYDAFDFVAKTAKEKRWNFNHYFGDDKNAKHRLNVVLNLYSAYVQQPSFQRSTETPTLTKGKPNGVTDSRQ